MSGPKIALIGFGEVGQVLAEDLARAEVASIVAWDIAFDDPATPAGRAKAEGAGEVAFAASAAEAVFEVILF